MKIIAKKKKKIRTKTLRRRSQAHHECLNGNHKLNK